MNPSQNPEKKNGEYYFVYSKILFSIYYYLYTIIIQLIIDRSICSLSATYSVLIVNFYFTLFKDWY